MNLAVFLLPLVGVVAGRRGLLVLTETGQCDGCTQLKGGCVERTVSIPSAANWTIQRIKDMELSDQEIDIEVINSCDDLNTGKWRLLQSLSNHSHSSNLHVILASSLSSRLAPSLTSLGIENTDLRPVSPRTNLRTLSRLVRHIGWREVVVLSSPAEAEAIGSSLLGEEICVTEHLRLPDINDAKDTFSSVIEPFRKRETKNLVVAGSGEQIHKFLRNLHELNVNAGVLALPWDGPLLQLIGTDIINSTLYSLVPMTSVMSEYSQYFKSELSLKGDVYDDPLAWQLVKSLFGILVLNDSTVDDTTVRQGLGLNKESMKYKIERFNIVSKLWEQVGVYEEAEFSWSRSQDIQPACQWCTCENGLWKGSVSWRWESWVIALATLAGLGLLCTLAVLVFLCSQCGQVLEGGQTTTFLLLIATASTFSSMLPYCFQPGGLVCIMRTAAPAGSLTLLVSVMLSRSLLLATADSEGLPGHASGCIQAALLSLMLGVEVGLLGLESWHLQGNFYLDSTCYHKRWVWLGMMAWPGLMLLVQTLLSPGIWGSRRNYKEGVLFTLSSVAIALVTAAWVAVYVMCAEVYGSHWEDISICAGLVSTATVVLLVIFIPKVYLMTVWGAGRDVSLHLPGTTTSTLHTDTLDYIPSANIYKTPVDENTVAYVNLGHRENGKPSVGSSHPSVHYGSAYIMGTRTLLDQKSNLTYRLDRNTEPAQNISWEPFTPNAGAGASSVAGNSHNNSFVSQSQSTLPLSPGHAGIPSTRL